MNVTDLICPDCRAFVERIPSNDQLPGYSVQIEKLCQACQGKILIFLNSKPKGIAA